MKVSKSISAIIVLLIIANVNFLFAQVNTTADGYKIGSAKKQIYPDNTYSFFSNEPKDFVVYIGDQTTATVIGRSSWYFDVPTWIPSGSQVYKVEFTYRTYNTYGFYANYISSLADSPTLQEIWDAVGNGSTVDYFPGSSGQQYTYDVTSSLNSIVQSAVNSSSKRIKLGFMSATETSNVPNTTLFYLGLKIYYDRPVSFTVRNNFNAGVLNVNGNGNFSSGGTVNTWETFTNTLKALEPQSSAGINYLWNDTEGAANKSKWERNKPGSTTDKGATQSISLVAVYDDNSAEFVANMRPYYGLTFQSPGSITINGSNYNQSGTVSVVEGNTASASVSTYFTSSDWISYSFNNWTWPGGSSTSTTITPTVAVNTTYTANYIGTANPSPMNIHFTSTDGQYISLAWTEHPNTNVTQYQVWRAVTGGSTGAIATLNRGTTSFTDYRYIQNQNGVTKLFYTVKAYYSPSGTWNDPGYLLNRGDLDLNIAKDNNQLNVVGKELPEGYSIGNYPNPFNPTTTISYQLPENGFVTIKVYDVLGKEVATLVNETKQAGYYNVNFDTSSAGGLTSGVYIYTINVNGFAQSKKMLLMK